MQSVGTFTGAAHAGDVQSLVGEAVRNLDKEPVSTILIFKRNSSNNTLSLWIRIAFMRKTFTTKSRRRRTIFISNSVRPTFIPKDDKIEWPLIESLNAMESSQGDSNNWTRQKNDVVAHAVEEADYQSIEAVKAAAKNNPFSLPDLFTHLPLIQDALRTESSLLQDEISEECLPFLTGTNNPGAAPENYGKHGLPCLEREEHVEFHHDSLEEHSSKFTALDASRAWILYWALAGLSFLGEDITQYSDR